MCRELQVTCSGFVAFFFCVVFLFVCFQKYELAEHWLTQMTQGIQKVKWRETPKQRPLSAKERKRRKEGEGVWKRKEKRKEKGSSV